MKIITTNRFRSLCTFAGAFLLGFGWLILLFGIVAGAIIIVGGGLVMWLHSPSMQAIVAKANDVPPMVKVSPFLLWAEAALAIGYTTSVFLFCQTLRGLLRSYAQGLYFAPAITRAYFRLAAITFALWVTDNLFTVLWAFTPASRVNWLCEFDFSTLFLAVVLVILAQVMGEGARVQEEQSLTV